MARGRRSRCKSRSRSRGRSKSPSTPKPTPSSDLDLGVGLGVGYILGNLGRKPAKHYPRHDIHNDSVEDIPEDNAKELLKDIYETCGRHVESIDRLLPYDDPDCREKVRIYQDEYH